MKFTKMQGAGNDFVVVETNDNQRDWSKIAIAVCDRHYGIGADGLLLLMPAEAADFRMRIFDADGSEAEACGNGIRCLVRYFVDNGMAQRVNGEIKVATMAGVRRAQVTRNGNQVVRIKIGMGKPAFAEEAIPAKLACAEKTIKIKSMLVSSTVADGRQLQLSLVSMGNPHAVQFVPEPVADYPLLELGPNVEHAGLFPRYTNFEIARVIDRRRIEARVWERGVGETLACGSGACAITVAARLHDYADDKVEVALPGGKLEVEWDGKGEVYLTGPAETVFAGEMSDSYLERLISRCNA